MVWHYHECIQFKIHVLPDGRRFQPFDFCLFANVGQFYFAIDDFIKKMLPVLCTDGYKMGRMVAIIPPRGTRGWYAVFIIKQFGHVKIFVVVLVETRCIASL